MPEKLPEPKPKPIVALQVHLVLNRWNTIHMPLIMSQT